MNSNDRGLSFKNKASFLQSPRFISIISKIALPTPENLEFTEEVQQCDCIYNKYRRDYKRADGKRYFGSTAKDLYGLEIPSVIWNMSSCEGACLKFERQVLLDINHSLGGKHWKHKWDIDKTSANINSSIHCDWHGILCDVETKHIFIIHLQENNLKGILPVNVTSLQFLLAFRISANSVHGQFNKIVAAMPRYLLCLDLTDTKIAGIIPKRISINVPILSKLQLSGSMVSGTIPESIGNLVHLTVLSLGETQIHGSIPQSISRLTKIWFLDLETLRLKGNLSFLYNYRYLKYLHLSSNEIIGAIPEDIGETCSKLTELLLQSNELNGHLPRSIGKLNNLRILNVEKNKLSGLIPRDLCDLQVKVLILSSNKFTGIEKSSNHSFKSLEMLIASHLPEFNGSLHAFLSYIKGSRDTIMQIDISHSNVHGHLPGFVFSFLRLTSLKLASNNLIGPIPDPFHAMPYLTLLDLQDNDFSGPIPMTFSRLIMLTELNTKGNKRLKGAAFSSFLTLEYTLGIKERTSDTCPMVKFAHNNGTVYVDSSFYNRSYCYCDEHFFGFGKHCIPCMHGGSCQGTNISHFKSIRQLAFEKAKSPITVMSLKKGYFPFPNESDVKSIHRCPSSGHFYKACAPAKNCDCYVNATEKKDGLLGRSLSPGNNVKVYCNSSCLCLRGHHGRYCSQCIDGYYKEGIRCYQCAGGPTKIAKASALFGLTIGSILVTVIILCISKKRLRLSVTLAFFKVMLVFFLVFQRLIPLVILQIVLIIFILGFSSHLQRCTALLKSAMFYFQIMDSLISTTDIWPKSVYSLQIYISSSLNLSFSSLACTLPGFFTLVAKSAMLFSLPILCIGMLWIVFCLFSFCRKPTKDSKAEFNCKCRKYSIVIIDLAYFPVVKNCFSILTGCRDIEGVSFMKRYVWIDCNSSEYVSLTVIAVLELSLYVIAVPVVIYVPLLLRFRNHLSDDNSIICTWLSPLIKPYKPRYRTFFELFMLLRRLLIAILMTSFPANSFLQIQCITILLLIAIIFQAVTRPFKNPTKMNPNGEIYNERLGLENGIEIFMLSCVLLSFICAGLSSGHRNFVPSTAFIILLLINGIFVVAFCCSILYRLLCCGSKIGYDDKSLHQSECLINAEEDCNLRESSDS